ncbi:J domain-containing protein [Mycobacterium hubeiense]|uniref:J domain-containing protein n=1 Tax=Mycobacterium hubeiense TaxID=1867256 RepID=UPI000C7F2618|nr:J domain-containing protein [Mycobacterium sp. QGD 101]
MDSRRFDPYAVLGVSPTATQAEIAHAYRHQLRALHPDTRASAADPMSADDERLQRVVAAYGLLRDPARRAEYDRDASVRAGVDRRHAARPADTPGPVRIPVRHVRSQPRPSVRRRPPVWLWPVRRIPIDFRLGR